MVKKQVQRQHRYRQDHGQGHVSLCHGQHTAEHIVVHIGGHAGGPGDHQNTDGQRRSADGGDGGITVPVRMAGHPQQEERRQNDHRNGKIQRRYPQRHGDGQRTEGDVAQAIADHGVPFQDQRNA